MPANTISGASCSVYPLNHPTLPTGLPTPEYNLRSLKSTSTGAVQEIATIESIAGTQFEIKLKINPTACSLLQQSDRRTATQLAQDDFLICLYLDGIDIQRCKRHRSQTGPITFSSILSTDLKTKRILQFGKLQLVDPDENDDMCEDEKIMQDLGTIKVNVIRCLLSPPKPPAIKRGRQPPSSSHRSRRHNLAGYKTTNQMNFSERSKKACQINTAGLGKAMPTPPDSYTFRKKGVRDVLQQDPHPFLQFIFKYKSRSTLEDEGLVNPRPPSPSPPRIIPSGSKTKKISKRSSPSPPRVIPSGSKTKKISKRSKTKSKEKEPECILIESESSTSDSSEDEPKQKATTTRHARGDETKANHIRPSGSSKNKWGENENDPHVIDDCPSSDRPQKGDSKKPKHSKDDSQSSRKVHHKAEGSRQKKAPVTNTTSQARNTVASSSNVSGLAKKKVRKGLENLNPWNFVDLTLLGSD